jgi:ubiquinone/menaquinone biosynthesis C-methylase UbiE
MTFKPRTYWEMDDFKNTYQMGNQKHREYLLDLLTKQKAKSFLDVGCGTGPLYQLIQDTKIPTEDGFAMTQRWNFKYKGTDYSRTMIETCKREFPHGDWEVQDARDLKEKDSSWDAVVIMHCLDHLDDYDKAIEEAARVAKKFVVIILWRGFVNEYTHLNDRNMYGKEEGDEPWEDTYLQEYSREALHDSFKKHNLIVMHETMGSDVSDEGKYNYLVMLKK